MIHNRIKFNNSKYQILNNDDLVLATFSNPKNKHFPHALRSEKDDMILRAKDAISEYFKANQDKFNQINSDGISQKNKAKSTKKPRSQHQLENERLAKKYNLEASDDDTTRKTLTSEYLNREI